MKKLKDELGVSSEERQFKEGGGMRSMVLRGQYINDFLLGNKNKIIQHLVITIR